jgi:transcription elongation GreA/GreB family factor
MNKAFVKDEDGAPLGEALPDREIPPHPNFVTAEGLAQIDAMLAEADTTFAAAQDVDDRDAMARAAREQRYWTSRRSTAQLVEPPKDHSVVRFGARVTIERDDKRKQTFRIVGLDEADPTKGTLSYISPMAQALMGKKAGDVVNVGGHEAEIVAIA